MVDSFSFSVPERPCDDEDEVNQGPDAHASKGQNHQDPGPGLSHIESVSAEDSQEKT